MEDTGSPPSIRREKKSKNRSTTSNNTYEQWCLFWSFIFSNHTLF